MDAFEILGNGQWLHAETDGNFSAVICPASFAGAVEEPDHKCNGSGRNGILFAAAGLFRQIVIVCDSRLVDVICFRYGGCPKRPGGGGGDYDSFSATAHGDLLYLLPDAVQ